MVRVQYHGLVTLEIMNLDLAKIGEGICPRYARGIKHSGPIVDDIGIKRAVLKPSKSMYEDAFGVSEYAQDWPVGVSELVNHEELPSRCRERPGSQHVPQVILVAGQRCPHAQMRRSEGGEVDWGHLVEMTLRVEQADGITSNQPAQGIPDDRELCDLVTIAP